MTTRKIETIDDLRKSIPYIQASLKFRFANELHEQIQSSGERQKDIAERAGKSEAYISKALRGDSNLTIETMVELVHAARGALHIKITDASDGLLWSAHSVLPKGKKSKPAPRKAARKTRTS
ncbi:MAG TPA: helix-turn-helix domain-containing protein [Pinirhizobacter sp.]|uniref:helix-turn-helix domain-containing protein n=1 Tax=Pinirhizobacter sp. TaxID=2950432 RepID=UPI002B6E16EF|nr:helix-turn-helix domain-containing protein [Pinirhizobacter sp.]HMH66348.1 helix-turn-helix domain-containing protein [Pinirhizobacter sp.]